MSNLEKLTTMGLIAPDTKFSAGEIAALDSMSEMEISTLVSAQMHVREQNEEPRIPTFHVGV